MYIISLPRQRIKFPYDAEAKESLLNILVARQVFIESPCGGRKSCGKCKIKHLGGELSPLSVDEEQSLTQKEIEEGIRLACHVCPAGDLEIDVIDQEENHPVLTGGYVPEYKRHPAIWKKVIEISKPTLADQTPYEELFKKALDLERLPWEVLRRITMGNGTYTAVYNQDQLIGLEKGDTFESLYGVAVDIGTTTVVASLIDLRTGEEVDSEAAINAQKNFGQDVLTRITYVLEHEEQGREQLQSAIVGSLNDMIRTMCVRRQIDPAHIYEVAIAANCTMMHMVLGVDPLPIGKSPYAPIFVAEKEIPARDIGLTALSAFARVYCLPAVSSYIGADIVAGAYVARLHERKDKVLFIDIGTNGEMVLANRGELVSCSCAAGPALEGMNISCGMRAADGAIEDIHFHPETGFALEVIGQKRPLGLCGSGILAVIRELLKHDFINARGNLVKPEQLEAGDPRLPYIELDGKKRMIRISEEPGKLLITQGDIRQVQLAKSAILSGFVALVNASGLSFADLDEVIVAGQFGAHLPVDSLVGTDILPSAVQEKVSYIGNSSKTGAYLALMSLEARQEMSALARSLDYMELSMTDGYERIFVDCSQFKVK
ncbi:putative metal-binding protein [Desulfosporosinus orientis DSM 765]|uniref:Putative metal-binding protein n=1 Tax=Desulfosporosinus orientis (strain ATCC 19365 / DSM 765 / NCIMB 8382 / VKM B-1628 / Singapore I) TaxID=768706 RepID=G7WD15_DESOD|nr:ASKHA domain-containing protein [Desulfosporosinus orientis]AET67210.1 putative metal-binding protein [Desulfosporosinus orientis DSM 765]